MYDLVVTRSLVIFGLLFQSLVMLCCGRWMNVPVLMVAGKSDSACCAPAPESSCCCCSESASQTNGQHGDHPDEDALTIGCGPLAMQCERSCACPATTDFPRFPGKTQREAPVEQLKAGFAAVGTPMVLPPLALVLKPTVVVELIEPPDEYGRLACERFCRWTI